MIAALFVATNGPYYGLPDVDPWDEVRDARKYAGPYPVVAHPPCERWGRYAEGGPNPAARRRVIGDDGGCFCSAYFNVRRFGGVMEHPEATHAYNYYNITRPPRNGGWIDAGDGRGFVCCVEQGNYGHAARKATWLYAVDCRLPHLKWGPSEGTRLEPGFHSKDEAKRERESGSTTSQSNGYPLHNAFTHPMRFAMCY